MILEVETSCTNQVEDNKQEGALITQCPFLFGGKAMSGIKGTGLKLVTFPDHENWLIHRVQEVCGVHIEPWFRREISNTMYGAAKTMLKGCKAKLERAEDERDKWREAYQQEAELNDMLALSLTNNPIIPPMHV